jgi:hypothetical protein
MDEKNCRKFLKDFAMWAKLPVPKVELADVDVVDYNKIQFCIGPKTNRVQRLQYIAVYWMLLWFSDPKHSDKIAGIVTDSIYKEPVNEQSTQEDY